MITMTDKEKFEGLKKRLIEENEEKYGREIREKYSEETVGQSNARFMNLTREEYDVMQTLAGQIRALLETAVKNGDSPLGESGRRAAALHRRWLEYTWPSYSRQAHIGLVGMYLEDERFKAYYDSRVDGCAQFLKDAVEAWA